MKKIKFLLYTLGVLVFTLNISCSGDGGIADEVNFSLLNESPSVFNFDKTFTAKNFLESSDDPENPTDAAAVDVTFAGPRLQLKYTITNESDKPITIEEMYLEVEGPNGATVVTVDFAKSLICQDLNKNFQDAPEYVDGVTPIRFVTQDCSAANVSSPDFRLLIDSARVGIQTLEPGQSFKESNILYVGGLGTLSVDDPLLFQSNVIYRVKLKMLGSVGTELADEGNFSKIIQFNAVAR